MLHNLIKKQLSAYLDDELSLRQKRRVEKHLSECEECSLLLQELREVSENIASLRQTATEDLWFGINARLDAIPSDLDQSLTTSQRWTWRWIHQIIKPVPVAIATALLIFGIFIQVFLRQPQEVSPQYTPMDVYLTAHTQYSSQKMFASDSTVNWMQQETDTESTEQVQQSTYNSELDIYLSVYMGDDEI